MASNCAGVTPPFAPRATTTSGPRRPARFSWATIVTPVLQGRLTAPFTEMPGTSWSRYGCMSIVSESPTAVTGRPRWAGGPGGGAEVDGGGGAEVGTGRVVAGPVGHLEAGLDVEQPLSGRPVHDGRVVGPAPELHVLPEGSRGPTRVLHVEAELVSRTVGGHRGQVDLLHVRPRHRHEQLGVDGVSHAVLVGDQGGEVPVLHPPGHPFPRRPVTDGRDRDHGVGGSGAVRLVEVPEQPGVVTLGETGHPCVTPGGLEGILFGSPDLVQLMQEQHHGLLSGDSARSAINAASTRRRTLPRSSYGSRSTSTSVSGTLN